MEHEIQKPLKVLVVGATGGSGRAAVKRLALQGHAVTAFSRNPGALAAISDRVTPMGGDATDPTDLERAVAGQDAVIVTLGISENPLRVRLFGPARTPGNVRSVGTRNVVRAMRRHGVKRLVVQSTYGVGDTAGLLRFFDQLFFKLVLKPQIVDTEAQEAEVRHSGVDWVLAQPVHLTNQASNEAPFASPEGKVRLNKVARDSVARFLATAACGPEFVGQSVALSG